MGIHADEIIVTNVGKKKLAHLNKCFKISTPTGMQFMAMIERRFFKDYFYQFFFPDHIRFITTKNQWFIVEGKERLRAKELKKGDKIQFEKGFLSIERIRVLYGKSSVINIISNDIDGRYYLANGLLVIH